MPQIDDSSVSPKTTNFLNGHRLETGPVKKKICGIRDYIWLHISANLWVKIPKFGGSKKLDKDFEKWDLQTQSPTRHPEGVAPPKMVPPYSLGTYPPKTPEHFDALLLLHWEKIDFLKTPDFGQSTQTALELPKIDICQNWPKGILGDVSSCLETKFDKKMSMGSVPNCWKEILMCHAIRWFKCKLKPPKNQGEPWNWPSCSPFRSNFFFVYILEGQLTKWSSLIGCGKWCHSGHVHLSQWTTWNFPTIPNVNKGN